MDLNLIWKSVLIVVVGTMLLRLAGRKSISQMTVSQTMIMIAIGSLLIQPVSGKNVWVTLIVAAILIGSLFVLEHSQVKFNSLEKLFTGKSKIIIENGILQESALKKMRLTVDQLEMQLRQNSIAKIEDVQIATLEPNGKLGFILKDEAKPATKKDIQKLIDLINVAMKANNLQVKANLQAGTNPQKDSDNIFTEIENPKSHSPRKLQ